MYESISLMWQTKRPIAAFSFYFLYSLIVRSLRNAVLEDVFNKIKKGLP